MRITPSDQPSNSDLSYRANRWIAVAICQAGRRFRRAIGSHCFGLRVTPMAISTFFSG